MADFDVAIVGSGFGGSLLAMALARLGRTVVMVERGRHPRFAIGESTSPLMNLLIAELANRYDLPAIAPLASYDAWMRAYPDVVRGLKRGFTFFHHEPGRVYRAAPDRSNQLLVAASPNDEVADTHWLRADVDHFLAREAVRAGAALEENVALDRVDREPSGAMRLTGSRDGARYAVRAKLVVDASGPRGFLARALGLSSLQTQLWVVLPQAFFNMVPAITGRYIVTIKNTSLAFLIGLSELTDIGKQINVRLMTAPIEVYVTLMLMYFVVNRSLSAAMRRLENRDRFNRLFVRI